jgi:hypothetical protein
LTNPLALALAADHVHAYVATGTGATDGAIRVISFPNATTLNISATPFNTSTTSPLGEIFGMAVSPSDGQLYVADRDNNKIIRFDSNGVGTDVITQATSPNLIKPTSLAFSANGATLYVGNASNNFNYGNAYVDQYDTATWTRSLFATGLSSSPALALTPDGRYLYVATGPAPGTTSDRILYYDTTQGSPTAVLFANTGFAANAGSLQWESASSLFASFYSAGVNTSTITHYHVVNNAVNGPVNGYHENGYMQGLTGMVLVDTPPTAANDSYSTDENIPLNVQAPGVLANDGDVDGDTLSAVPVQGPAHGQLVLNNDGSFTYTPTANFTGTDQFTYRASDGSTNSNLATVTLTVAPDIAIANVVVDANTAPIVSYTVAGSLVTVVTAGNATFASGQALLIAGVANSADNGMFTVQGGSSNSNTFTFVNSNAGAATAGAGGTASVVGGTGSLGTGGLGNGSQRSMVDAIAYTFNQPVNLAAGALTVSVHNGQSGTVPTVNYASPDGGVTWFVTFGGAGVSGNSIADGVYDILLDSTKVSAVSGGGTLASNRSDTFFRLFGDINGDQQVNSLVDHTQFKKALGSYTGQAAYLAALDFNGDGQINSLLDYSRFRLRLGSAFSGFTPSI